MRLIAEIANTVDPVITQEGGLSASWVLVVAFTIIGFLLVFIIRNMSNQFEKAMKAINENMRSQNETLKEHNDKLANHETRLQLKEQRLDIIQQDLKKMQ